MEIQVRLFAVLREKAGTDAITLDLANGSNVGVVLRSVRDRYPNLAAVLDEVPVVVAVNRSYVDEGHELAPDDEVALVPPVSGGQEQAQTVRARIKEGPLDPSELERFVGDARAGAIVTFQGVTREVDALTYEAYEEMAIERIKAICLRACDAHGALRAAVDHRVGSVPLSECSVAVSVSSAHRDAAFGAARDIIDQLKVEVPIWKQEIEGENSTWVEGFSPTPGT